MAAVSRDVDACIFSELVADAGDVEVEDGLAIQATRLSVVIHTEEQHAAA
jgi:hypothetical protein